MNKDQYWDRKEQRDIEGIPRMGRAHAQDMALRWFAQGSHDLPSAYPADNFEKWANSTLRPVIDWFQADVDAAAPAPQPLPAQPLQSQPRQGNGGQRTGFASDKQERWFKDLVGKACGSPSDAHTIWEYASGALTGGRGGGISQIIDQLKSDKRGELAPNAGEVAREVLQRAEAWKAQQTATPGNTSGLPEVA